MGRDELVELLARVRCGVSADELRACVPQIQAEVAEIQRKRSHFLEDACAAVLKQGFATTASQESESDGDTDTDVQSGDHDGTASPRLVEGITMCAAFAEPLVRALPARAVGEDSDVTRQRGVLVAFLLAVLARQELTPDVARSPELDEPSRLIARLVVGTGLSPVTLSWTLRVREELHMFQRMMLPTTASASESEEDEEDEDDGGDSDGESDSAWMLHTVAAAAGIASPLEYFLKERGQEYAFASWSPVGIVRLAVLLAAPSDPASVCEGTNSLMINSAYSDLFALGSVAQALLQAQTSQNKCQGLSVLKHALDRCAPGGLAIGSASIVVDTEPSQVSFAEAAAAFRKRDWVTPLVELASNAMVSFPDANDRALSLAIFRQLLQVVEVNHRFTLLRRLTLRCPYGNVAAILVDQLRNDTFRVWSNVSSSAEMTPYTSPELTTLIIDLLKLLVERDLKLHADLLASVASLIRFVAIRDKGNRTGFRAPEPFKAVKHYLDRLQSRLRSTIAEVRSAAPTTDTTDLHALLHDENSRFVLVEAALQATIDLLSS